MAKWQLPRNWPEVETFEWRSKPPEVLALQPPAATELRPPQRELGLANTGDILRRLRKEESLFTELSLSELEEFADLCSPLSFQRGEVLFSRGEPCTWLGLLLAGRCDAFLPNGKGELRMGEHVPGEMMGLARVALWERSHARAYTLRAIEDGCIAVLSYDQLEGIRRSRPAFHHNLLRSLLLQLADACGSFFRGCPVSNRPKWSLSQCPESRILDFLLKLREEGRLLANADYNCLLTLACRLRITQWQARSNVLSKGEPLSGALILFDGKMTGFRDAGGSPSMFFNPGDCIGLEYLLGGVQLCPLDVFAARASLAALLRPDDLQDIRRENPAIATQILQALHGKFFMELAAPHSEPLLLMAEATERLRFATASRPSFPSPLRFVGQLTPDEAKMALQLAQSTAPVPRWVDPEHSHKVLEGQAAREEAAIRRFLSDPHGLTASWAEKEPAKAEWLLGSFLTKKLVDGQLGGAQGRAAAREAAARAVSLEAQRESTRQSAMSPGKDLLNVEARLGLSSPRRGDFESPRGSPTSRQRSQQRSHWKETGLERKGARSNSAPPMRAATSHWPNKMPGGEQGIMELLSHPPPFFNCPQCSKKIQVPKSIWPKDGGGVLVKTGPSRGPAIGPQLADSSRRRVARVISSTYRHGNRADFFIDGKKVPLESGKWQLHEYQRRGFNVVTLDPDTQHVASATCYDTSGGGQVAVSQLASDLNALPEGRVVLIAVRGSGLESLSGAAMRALRRVGATAAVSGGRSQEGYALIGIKGGDAAAERRGHHVEVEAKLPKPPWQEPQDLSWYFQQQKQFLEDLKVCEDRHEAWNSKVFMQEDEIEKLKQQVKTLEEERDNLRKDVKEVLRERDEWQVAALRVMSKREFRSSVESLEAARRRPLPP